MDEVPRLIKWLWGCCLLLQQQLLQAKLFVVLNPLKPYSKACSAASYNQFHWILSLTSLFLAIFWFSDHLSLLSSSTLLPPSRDTQVCLTFSVLFFIFGPGTFLYLPLSPFLHSSASFILLLLVLHFSRHLSQSPWFFPPWTAVSCDFYLPHPLTLHSSPSFCSLSRRGVVRVDVNLQDVDIDQCSASGWFAGTHRCNLTSMEVSWKMETWKPFILPHLKWS